MASSRATRAFAAFALAVCAAAPAAAGAGSDEIPVTIVFGGSKEGSDVVKLKSEAPECVENRDVSVEPLGGHVTDENGEFAIDFFEWGKLGNPDLTATVEAGPTVGDKQCAADSSTLALNRIYLSVDSFKFKARANSFSGKVSAERARCLREVDVILLKSEPSGFEKKKKTSPNRSGEYTFKRKSSSTGTWTVLADAPEQVDRKPGGDALITSCFPAQSGILVVD